MEARESTFQGKAALLRATVLGVSAWATLVLMPEFAFSPLGPAPWGFFALGALPPILLGCFHIPRVRDGAAAPWLALVAVPASLALAVAVRGVSPADPADEGTFVVASVIAWLAYGAAALAAFSFPRRARRSTVRRLDFEQLPSTQRLRRAIVMGLGAAFAFAATVVVPTWGGLGAYEDAWGAAAKEARLLAVIVGGTLSTVAMAMFLGPALRLSKVAATKSQSERRAAIYLATATIAVLVLLAYVRSK